MREEQRLVAGADQQTCNRTYEHTYPWDTPAKACHRASGVCEWSIRLRSIQKSHAHSHRWHELAARLVRGWRSTATRGATPNLRVKGASHTYLLAYSCFLRGTVIYLSANLSGWLAGWRPSALCSVLPCTPAHTGLASSGRARCRRWQCPQAQSSRLAAVLDCRLHRRCRFRNLEKRGGCAMRPRSLPVLVWLEPTPSHHTRNTSFGELKSLFSGSSDSSIGIAGGDQSTSFAPKHVTAHGM